LEPFEEEGRELVDDELFMTFIGPLLELTECFIEKRKREEAFFLYFFQIYSLFKKNKKKKI